MSNYLTPFFSYKFTGDVWRVLADSQQSLLLLEIREANNFQVKFAAIDCKKGEKLFDDWIFPEPWWIGIYQIHNGIAYFYTYPDDQKPEVKGVSAWDIRQKKLVWEDKNSIFHEINGDKLITYTQNQEGLIYEIRRMKDGKISEQINQIPVFVKKEQKDSEVFLPENYVEGTEYFTKVSDFLQKKMGYQAIQEIDYLEYKNTVIMAYITKFC